MRVILSALHASLVLQFFKFLYLAYICNCSGIYKHIHCYNFAFFFKFGVWNFGWYLTTSYRTPLKYEQYWKCPIKDSADSFTAKDYMFLQFCCYTLENQISFFFKLGVWNFGWYFITSYRTPLKYKQYWKSRIKDSAYSFTAKDCFSSVFLISCQSLLFLSNTLWGFSICFPLSLNQYLWLPVMLWWSP